LLKLGEVSRIISANGEVVSRVGRKFVQQSLLAPLLTEKDYADSSEGGIDPLGTEPLADALAVRLAPGGE
jgi:hypothetical protein